jgi:tetratricopeptide (TPR) repeat protein
MKSHQQFFEKALAIQAQRQEKLTEAEKKEIALQLGFSEADWQAVLASFEAHLKRGKEFLKRYNYEKAITELEDALIIQPEHTDTLAALAQAYLGEFQSKKRKNLKEKALQYAQECLRYSPKNQEAHQVIDAFNPNKPITSHPQTPQASKAQTSREQKSNLTLIVTSIVLGTAIFLAMVIIPLRMGRDTSSKKQQSTSRESSESTSRESSVRMGRDTSSKKQQSTSRESTKPKHNHHVAQNKLQLLIESENEEYPIEAQKNQVFLIKNSQGEAIFRLKPHYIWWTSNEYAWTDDTWKGKLKYDFRVQGLFEIETLAPNLAAGISFKAYPVGTEGQFFYTDFNNQFVSTEAMPDDFVYPPNHPTFIKFSLPVLRQGQTFEEELPFNKTEKPTQLKLVLKKLRFTAPQEQERTQIPVFYNGQEFHHSLKFFQVGKASGYAPSDGIFAYHWAFVFEQSSTTRKIVNLRAKVKFFNKNNHSIRFIAGGWSSELVYEADFPPLANGKLILRGFKHDLGGIKEADEVLRKEIHIEEIAYAEEK